MPESQILFLSRNVGKMSNVIAYEEMTQFRTMPKVSKVRILLLSGLILSDNKVFCS